MVVSCLTAFAQSTTTPCDTCQDRRDIRQDTRDIRHDRGDINKDGRDLRSDVRDYRDEWAETLADPERIRRFARHVNLGARIPVGAP